MSLKKMSLKLSQTVFGTNVTIARSGERGVITGFALHKRSKANKQFFVEYTDADGRATEGWFFEDQLQVIT